MNNTIFCIIGESCSGKDSLINKAIEHTKHKLVISYTDRPKRRLERDGVEHYFLSTEEFDKLKNDNKDNIVAYTKISKDDNDGYQYMALKSELDKADTYIIDPNGFYYLKKKFPNLNLVPIYINCTLEDRLYRAKKRSDLNKFMDRVNNEHEQFEEFLNNDDYITLTNEEFFSTIGRKILDKYFDRFNIIHIINNNNRDSFNINVGNIKDIMNYYDE